MKKTSLLLIGFLLSQITLFCQSESIEDLSQKEFNIAYNWTQWGYDASLSYQHTIAKNSIFAGLNFFVNTPIRDSRGFTFRHRFQAMNWYEHLGFHLGYSRQFQLIRSKLEMHPFMKIQYFRIGSENIFGTQHQPFSAVNSTLGLAFQVKVYKEFFLKFAADGGAIFYQTNQFSTGERITWEVSNGFSIGLVYRYF